MMSGNIHPLRHAGSLIFTGLFRPVLNLPDIED